VNAQKERQTRSVLLSRLQTLPQRCSKRKKANLVVCIQREKEKRPGMNPGGGESFFRTSACPSGVPPEERAGAGGGKGEGRLISKRKNAAPFMGKKDFPHDRRGGGYNRGEKKDSEKTTPYSYISGGKKKRLCRERGGNSRRRGGGGGGKGGGGRRKNVI